MINRKTEMLTIQLIAALCFLIFFPVMSQAEITLTVGDANAVPGEIDVPVEVGLINLNDKVVGVQIDVCDVDNYLSCTACETTERTSGFNCAINELEAGCCRALLFSTDRSFVEEGTGPLFTINYNVLAEAPLGECRDLYTENTKIQSCVDDGEGKCNNGPLFEDVTFEDGEFCFPCVDDDDCGDGLYCNGDETCDGDGICQSGTDPCLGQECDETLHCVDCLNDADCDNGVFCDGDETCDGNGICQPGTDPCLGQECDETLHCVDCLNDADCDNGVFCDGDETCDDDGICQSGTDPCPGQSCNESDDTCKTITSTTTSINPPSPPPPPPPPPPPTSTTTTAISHSYKVTIIPSSATLDSGATFQFSAKTTDGGEEIEGNYDWEIDPASTIGSEIDDEGLFTAGDNATDSEINKTVKVTDTAHENKSATATVTIKVKKEPAPECEVVINPSSATVSSRSTLALGSETTGDGCKPGDYEWLIESEIGSVIDQEGNYSAGVNNTGSQTTDVITVVDHANANISGSASIMIESKITSVFPNTILGSRWIPLPYFLLILGEDTKLKPSSTIIFEPDDDILKIAQIKLFNSFLVIVLVNADPQEGPVAVTISSGEEVITGEVTIELLSLTNR